jgi:hypothetical protein
MTEGAPRLTGITEGKSGMTNGERYRLRRSERVFNAVLFLLLLACCILLARACVVIP